MHPHWNNDLLPAMRDEAHFGDRVVRCFVDRPASVDAMFRASCTRHPGNEALVFEGRRWTYAQLSAWVDGAARVLSQAGVKRGDRVALWIGNRPEFVLAFLATQRIGAITVPISTREQAPGLAYMLEQCGAVVLLHDAVLADKLPQADQAAACRRWSVEHWCAAIQDSAPLPPLDPAPHAEDTAVILYTSGTTGRPKGAMLTHFNIAHSVLHFIHGSRWTDQSRSIMAAPASHVTGLIANIATAIGAGACTIIMAAFKASEYLRLAQAEGLTHTILVPAMYNLCLLDPDFESYDLSRWQRGGYGGAPMPAATIDALARKLPSLKLQNCYGATETTSPTTMMPAEYQRDHLDSVGFPMHCAQIRIMDDEGREVPPGETGEIWISGPMVVKGYWDNPEATAREFTAGFWHSGDLGSMDAQGFVRVFDRKKDMLNRGGFKIYSVEVENLMIGFPGVVEAAVIGKPCPVLGERVHAFVYAGDTGASSLDVQALRAYCAQHLADYKVPETITVEGEPLPRNANGKLMKRLMREKLLAG